MILTSGGVEHGRWTATRGPILKGRQFLLVIHIIYSGGGVWENMLEIHSVCCIKVIILGVRQLCNKDFFGGYFYCEFKIINLRRLYRYKQTNNCQKSYDTDFYVQTNASTNLSGHRISVNNLIY